MDPTVTPGPANWKHDANGESATLLRTDAIRVAGHPRAHGINESHARLLADSADALPPIVVCRRTMRVIDGLHRLRAAQLLGQAHIRAVLFDGDEEEAFVLAVDANIRHGLPLSLTDRKSAAARILRHHPDWSDRAIARLVGISGKTVASVRRQARSAPSIPSDSAARIGRDGRVRPLNSSRARQTASEIIMARPQASLREVARSAGLSPSTVREVRGRILRGESSSPDRGDAKTVNASAPEVNADECTNQMRPGYSSSHLSMLRRLRRDPSLRYSEAGRRLLRWLEVLLLCPDEYKSLTQAIPPHCSGFLGQLARQCSARWSELADEVERRGRESA